MLHRSASKGDSSRFTLARMQPLREYVRNHTYVIPRHFFSLMPGYHDASSTGCDEDCKALLFARWTAAAPVIVIRSEAATEQWNTR